MGAHDGESCNNTLYFEKNNNWTGINIEPIKKIYDKLVVNRPSNINLNCAVCNIDGETDFYLNTGHTEMISGIVNNFDPRHLQRLIKENNEHLSITEVVKVKTKRLETIFDENNISHINYLSIDVEGAEFDVIKSINFDKVFIDVIGFENNYHDTSIPIIKFLENNGFVFIYASLDIFMINTKSIFYNVRKNIAFLSNKLTLRGTEIAMYDYADYNETLLNNKSIIITRDYKVIKHEFDVSSDAYDKFHKRFTVEYYKTQKDIDIIVKKHNITHLYIIKAGGHDGLISTKCKNLIHCVFNTRSPHGEIYSAISNDVNRIYGTNFPVVPHMVRIFETELDMRKQLNIPNEAIVFGRYGGVESFDINFVKKAIVDILQKRKDVYFIFMNTYEFSTDPHIIYISGTTNMKIKRMFINTCDALIHAREGGETFGLVCGEFAMALKPVITYGNSHERNHIDVLGDKAVLYKDYESVYKILDEFEKNKYDMSDNGFLFYNPENIMRIFDQVYLSE